MKKTPSVFLNFLIIVCGLIGLYDTVFTSGGFMNAGTLRYYTVQSNILVMITAAICLGYLLKKCVFPKSLEGLRFVSATAILLTFLVFAFMLTPQMISEGNSAYFKTMSNIMLHNLVPIAAVADWLAFGSVKSLKNKAYCLSLIPPAAYLVYVFFCVRLGLTFSGQEVPYFFLNFRRLGWFTVGKNGLGVIPWIIVLAAVIALMGRLMFGAVRRRENKQK